MIDYNNNNENNIWMENHTEWQYTERIAYVVTYDTKQKWTTIRDVVRCDYVLLPSSTGHEIGTCVRVQTQEMWQKHTMMGNYGAVMIRWYHYVELEV